MNDLWISRKSNKFYSPLFDYFIEHSLQGKVDDSIIARLYEEVSEMISRDALEALRDRDSDELYFSNETDFENAAFEQFHGNWFQEGWEERGKDFSLDEDALQDRFDSYYNDGFNHGYDSGLKKGEMEGFNKGVQESFRLPI